MTRTRLIPVACLAAAALATLVILRGGDGHIVRASFPSAINLVSGAEVRAGGVKVGTVRSIEFRRGVAELRLGIDDERLWPLREGTRARIRLGGTVSYANRYVELVPGTGRELRENAELGIEDTTSPVEFDELFNVLDRPTRAGLGKLVDSGAATFGSRAAGLRAGLPVAGTALDQAAATFDGLSADPYALETLLRAGAGVSAELARHDAELHGLVARTAETLRTTARSGSDVRATLRRLPGALQAAQGTLGRVDGTLGRVDRLVTDIRPGGRELRRVVAPLGSVVDTLADVSPQLGATLAKLRRGGPEIARFLTEAVPQVKRLRPVMGRLTPMLGCLRAYAPEVAGLLSTWASFNTGYDASGRYAWLNGQSLPFPNETPLPSRSIAERFPQLQYSLVRAPGDSVGQGSLLPSCGATEASRDAANDPEARG